MQIRKRDGVVIDDSERPDARARKILQRRRAEASRAHDEDARALQLVLTGSADAAQHDLAGVALNFFAR